ncbi:NAD(P)/FAD-dependent oxidoreductase [Aureimonas leprariae]|uniref:FAD-dependent oxidoreductase n=1 Tax=Plantimonas leprariae TaxID=2615207 RepID=A0A7V7PM51_9HYPH|nr:FAD-dependent oxidoreductase [Aureimonas leprariae]KAB0677696.1 FAD-dependent oxidoreductase [Aureimonas leprariae]
MRTALVLGAGAVGVSSALHLQRRGWQVALVDRQAPGRATSYGNAGIVQSEAVEPYAMPRSWPALLAIVAGRTNDVRYDPRALPLHAGALLRYWWHSAPSRHRRIASAYATLIRSATAEHGDLIEAAGAGALVRTGGYRVLHRTAAAMDAALREAERLRSDYGVAFVTESPDELRLAEPALKAAGAGAILWPDAWVSSDPGALVESYAALFRRLGGTVAIGDASTLAKPRTGWSVRTSDGAVGAEAAVVALGPWSPEVLKPLGYSVPMVLKRGYHRHWTVERTLRRPLMDAANGCVLAQMRQGLRITTGAELTGRDAPVALAQLQRAEAAAAELLELGGPVEKEPWFGTRPCMPDMLPVVGPAPRHSGLWFNFGHGHQGLTLGPASGRLLAELMSGEAPHVSPGPFGFIRPAVAG